jgi:myosin-7
MRLQELERKEAEMAIEDSRVIAKKKEALRQAEAKQTMPLDDGQLVEEMFGFLKAGDVSAQDTAMSMPGNAHAGPSAFRDLGGAASGSLMGSTADLINAVPMTAEDVEDLSEYKFHKFAATYFQGNSNHAYSRKPLKQPLLTLHAQGDQLVCEDK